MNVKGILMVLLVFGVAATGFKACSNALFVEGHPHSHVLPTSPEAARKIGSLISEYEPSIPCFTVNGTKYRISKAWAEYRTKRSHRLVWFPIYPQTGGVYVTVQLEGAIPAHHSGLRDVPLWLNLEDANYTYLSRNQFTGMQVREPRNHHIFTVTNRISKDEIARIELEKK